MSLALAQGQGGGALEGLYLTHIYQQATKAEGPCKQKGKCLYFRKCPNLLKPAKLGLKLHPPCGTAAVPRGSTKKDPALVVFRLCFGTSSEHLEQAGCFRLPLTACRPQPALCVPESFNLRSKFSSRSPRTGQGKFKFKPGKERDYLPQHPCQCRESSRGKLEKERQRLLGPGSCPRTRHQRHLVGRASTAKLRPTQRLGGDSDTALVALALFQGELPVHGEL